MAANAKNSGGDMVLGGRHLMGIFVLLVVIFGLVFTLGYLLGRSQYDTQLHAAASTLPVQQEKVPDKTEVAASHTSADPPGGPPASDWDFFHSAEPAKPAETVAPSAEPKAAPAEGQPAATVPAKSPAPFVPPVGSEPLASAIPKSLSAPVIPHGETVLQVAALGRQADATDLAQALQQKKFPAFVLTPTTDQFYRVQVGPYADAQSANTARKKLESQGFKSIPKR